MTLVVALGLPLVILFIFLYYGRSAKLKGLPPGPRGLPFLGNIAQLHKNPHLKLSKWAREYGKLYTIKVGTLDTLVVSDVKLMKGIFGHPASTGKFRTETILQISKGLYGVINTEGACWQEQRQYCMRSLVQHGLSNRTSTEQLILPVIQEVVDLWKEESKKNNKVSLHETFRIAVQSVTWAIESGQRVGMRNHKVNKFTGDFLKAVDRSVETGLLFMPWLKYIAPQFSGYNDLVRNASELHAFTEEFFHEHRKTQTPGAPRDMIDSYLEQMDKHRDNPSSSFHGEIGVKNSIAIMVELFIASTVTSANTLNWLVLYLCDRLDTQAKLHEEIDRVVGNNREPTLNDQQNMPYTVAVIQETLRKSSIPFGVIHSLLEDIEMFGYKLPKGLLILPNLYHIHHNQEIWGDPENFRPERFLEIRNFEVKLIKNENLIPFQVGKRECAGEPLAKDMLFLFVTKLLQSFQFLPDPDKLGVDLEPDYAYHLYAKPFHVVLKARGKSGSKN